MYNAGMPGAQARRTDSDLQAAWKKFNRKVANISSQTRKIMTDAEIRKDRQTLLELKRRIQKN